MGETEIGGCGLEQWRGGVFITCASISDSTVVTATKTVHISFSSLFFRNSGHLWFREV